MHGRDHAPGGADPIPGAGGGIDFDVENDGGWLYITTEDETEAGGSPTGHGILLDDFSAGGIDIAALGGGDAEFRAQSGGRVFIRSTSKVTVSSTGSNGLLLQATAGDAIMQGQGVSIENDDVSGEVEIGATGLVVRVSPTSVTIDDGSIGTPGSPFLVVDVTGGGSYHILTGASWVADL